MDATDARSLRLRHLLTLASAYRGISRKQLSDALGRDQTKIAPRTGNPKLDYLVRLADILDWPVGEVAEAIWDPPRAGAAAEAATFEELNDQAKAAHVSGDFRLMTELARRMRSRAETSEQRALAALRESGGWNGLGRYTAQVDAIRRGLRESPLSADLRSLLRVNLANGYHTLGHHLEARAMAREFLDSPAARGASTPSGRASVAFACYVAGHASRALIGEQPDEARLHAGAAQADLLRGAEQYEALAAEFQHAPWRGIGSTCRGGLLEAEVELGVRSARAAVEAIRARLDEAPAVESCGDEVESIGWWCIFGCNIALRHLSGAEMHRHMAVFTNKGCEIADRLGNWAMRERLFSLEFVQRERLNELAGVHVDWTIDDEDVRLIVGTMGRFPAFRSVGWQILQNATLVSER